MMLQGKRSLETETKVCSVRKVKPKRTAQGGFFTSSRPGHSPPEEVNTKAASTGGSAVTQQGSPTAELTAQRMKVVCHSHSTRKQLPGQCWLIWVHPAESCSSREGECPRSLPPPGNLLREKGWDVPHLYTIHLQCSEGLLHTTALLSHRDSTELSREHRHKSISHLQPVSLWPLTSLQKATRRAFPHLSLKGAHFQPQRIAATPKMQCSIGLRGRRNNPKLQCGDFNIQEI